jgi:hypothetical protein
MDQPTQQPKTLLFLLSRGLFFPCSLLFPGPKPPSPPRPNFPSWPSPRSPSCLLRLGCHALPRPSPTPPLFLPRGPPRAAQPSPRAPASWAARCRSPGPAAARPLSSPLSPGAAGRMTPPVGVIAFLATELDSSSTAPRRRPASGPLARRRVAPI